MWGYYGAKTNIIDLYPAPKHDKVIEPFCGSARYALRYFDKDVVLVDKYPVVIGIWKWLQKCSVGDIKGLPHFVKAGQSLDDFTFDDPAAKDLMGFLIGFGMERPRKTASAKRMIMRPNHVNYSLNRIEKELWKIKNWSIQLGSYSDIKNQTATWFIDPPYQFGGACYPMSSKKINFQELALWSKERQGEIIVCENHKATWLPFIPLGEHKTRTGMQKEVIYTNMELPKPLAA